MSLAVKCSRLLPSACRYMPRCSAVELSTDVRNSTSQESVRNNTNFAWGIAGFCALGTLYASGYRAKAKVDDEDDEDDEDDGDDEDDEMENYEAMSALIEDGATEEVQSPSDGPDRFELWKSVQEKYLLLSETQRAETQLRDITDDELATADLFYEEGKLTDLEDLLIELNTVSPHNDQVLWRLARMKWVLGRGYSTYHAHKVFHVGHSLACKAAEINPENGDAHRWIAVLSFYRAEKDGPAAGARNLEGMKYHLEKALELNPDDSVAMTLLGNWYFECAEMSWLTRKWCKLVAGVEAPAGSYKKALALFQKSDSVEKWVHNTYWTAKTLLRLQKQDEALKIFNELANTVIVSGEDFRMRKEAHIHIKRLTNPPPVTQLISSLIPGYLENWRVPLVFRDNISTYNEDTNWNMIRGKTGPHDPTF